MSVSKGSVVQGSLPWLRRHDNDLWWLRQEHQPFTMAGQLRVLGGGGPRSPHAGTRYSAGTVPSRAPSSLYEAETGAEGA
ncbi:hypothetical protein [Streptomyces sp. NPDC058335]|uniref:hypothetical protein n=1 Tax=Streptomyces sp. NPDC058335 TaxID=3346451 RepID=UPI00365FC5CC